MVPSWVLVLEGVSVDIVVSVPVVVVVDIDIVAVEFVVEGVPDDAQAVIVSSPNPITVNSDSMMSLR